MRVEKKVVSIVLNSRKAVVRGKFQGTKQSQSYLLCDGISLSNKRQLKHVIYRGKGYP